VWPPAYESSSRVLLQGDPDTLGKDRLLSEAQVAMSLLVLDRAAAGLNWGVDGPGLRDSVTAAVADGNVIEIKAKADSADRARQLAERVTQQYIAFSAEILTKSASASSEVLAPRKDGLLKQIGDMNRRISALQGSVAVPNAQGATAGAELQQLSNNRTDAVKELNDLDGLIAKAQAQTAASRHNYSVIEPPVAPAASLPPTRLELVAGGSALAATLGVLAMVAVRQSDRRLRRGSDIAAALGAPVLGTVEAPADMAVASPINGSSNGHDAGDRRALLRRLLRNAAPRDVPLITESTDQPLEYLRYRRVLARLRGAPQESVRLLVVVVDDDVLASRAVGRLAIAAAVDGRPVSVVTSSPQLAETVKDLLAASRPDLAPINVDVSTSTDHSRSAPAPVLSVVPVSAARPTVPDSVDVSGVLVVVTSGTRTAWELLAIAEACQDAGHPVAGVLMVVDADEDAEPEQFRLSAAVGPPRGRAGGGPA
jgi:capsular polysaccharide biosynthesis protein